MKTTFPKVPAPAVFGPIAHLAELHIGANPFESVGDGAFAGMPNLYRLDVAGGSVRNLTGDAFRGLATLRILSLAGNALDAVPGSQLAGLDRLEELYLGGNYFETLSGRALPGLKALKLLDLAGSRNLAFLAPNSLEDNVNLARLSLAGCRHVDWTKIFLSGPDRLEALDLTDAGITSLPAHLTGLFSGLSDVRLGQNGLACDCRLRWLREILRRGNMTGGPALCRRPRRLAGQKLVELNPGDMTCGGDRDEAPPPLLSAAAEETERLAPSLSIDDITYGYDDVDGGEGDEEGEAGGGGRYVGRPSALAAHEQVT